MRNRKAKGQPGKSTSGTVATSRLSTLDTQPLTILLAVTGTSPAVLTETIWALAQEDPPVIPDRVIVITTTVGSEQLQKALFTARPEFQARPFDALSDYLRSRGQDVSARLRYEERIIRRWNERQHAYELLADIRNRADNDAA